MISIHDLSVSLSLSLSISLSLYIYIYISYHIIYVVLRCIYNRAWSRRPRRAPRSVGRLVGRSVGQSRSVGWSVGRSVGRAGRQAGRQAGLLLSAPSVGSRRADDPEVWAEGCLPCARRTCALHLFIAHAPCRLQLLHLASMKQTKALDSRFYNNSCGEAELCFFVWFLFFSTC